MAYKTPNKTSEYIRDLMGAEKDPNFAEIIKQADVERIPILLPEAVAFLKQLLMLHRPKKVLEIGTAIGYSGCIFLRYSDCKLVTIDKNNDYLSRACQLFDSLGFGDRYEAISGDAGEIIPSLQQSFDFIFLDGPKAQYVKYLPILKSLLESGGILLADNVLFNGMVSGETEADTKKKSIVTNLDNFLKQLCSDDDFITSIINVGDGMSLSIKK